MGRKRKYATEDGDVVPASAIGDGPGMKSINEAVQRRLGFENMICQSCNANNPPSATSCRKCGHSNLRRKRTQFADK